MITTTTADPDLTLLKNTFCIGFPCKLSDKKKGRGPCRPCGSWKFTKFFFRGEGDRMIHDTKKVGDARPEAEQTLIRVTMDYFNLHFNY